jgi:signal transduction histidine kinase
MNNIFKIVFALVVLCNFLFASDAIKSKVDSVNTIPYKYIVSNLQNSVNIFTKNVELAQSINYKYGEAVALDKLSLASGVSGDHEESTVASFKAMKIFEDLGAVEELSMVYGGYGFGVKRRDMDAANRYLRKGIRLAEEHNLFMNLTTLYDHYGIVKLEEENPDSAFYYYNRALSLKYQLKDTVGIPYSLNKIAGIHLDKKEFDLALNIMKQSDEYRDNEEGEFGRTMNLANYGDIYMAMKNYDDAIKYYKRALEKGESINFQGLVQYCYEKLTTLYEIKNEDKKALENYKKYVALKDSVTNAETVSKTSEIQVAYETEKKDRLIAENEIELQTKSYQLYFSIGLLTIILGSLVFTYRYHQLKQARIRRELELKNQIKQAELEQKISDEKLRISKELHDNVGSNLTFMISSLDNMEYGIKDEEIQSKMKNLGSFGRETMEDLRDSIWAIKNEDGDICRLLLKVKELKRKINENLSKPEILIHEEIEKADYLNSVQMLNMFRLIQEAIQNSIKHANANKAKINFFENPEMLKISIIDDGDGFDTESNATGNGLDNMKSRCTSAGGNLEISSSKDGTQISCKILKK